jgi:hypothetical protein
MEEEERMQAAQGGREGITRRNSKQHRNQGGTKRGGN